MIEGKNKFAGVIDIVSIYRRLLHVSDSDRPAEVRGERTDLSRQRCGVSGGSRSTGGVGGVEHPKRQWLEGVLRPVGMCGAGGWFPAAVGG